MGQMEYNGLDMINGIVDTITGSMNKELIASIIFQLIEEGLDDNYTQYLYDEIGDRYLDVEEPTDLDCVLDAIQFMDDEEAKVVWQAARKQALQ